MSVNRYLFMIIRKPGTVVTLNWQYYYQKARERPFSGFQHLIIKSITTLRDKMFVLRDLGPEQEDDQPGLVWPGPVSMAENVKIINDRSILERAGARPSKTNN